MKYRMETEKIYTQHNENKEWAGSLFFYKDEIRIMEHRLEEISQKNSSKQIMAKVEQFQNQLIVCRNTIDEIKHKVNLSEDELQVSVMVNAVAVDHRRVKDHTDLRHDIKIFEHVFTGIKSELNLFLIKCM
jgi:hypothetical protein